MALIFLLLYLADETSGVRTAWDGNGRETTAHFSWAEFGACRTSGRRRRRRRRRRRSFKNTSVAAMRQRSLAARADRIQWVSRSTSGKVNAYGNAAVYRLGGHGATK